MNKIRNFIEDVILILKNKMFSSKYVLKGKCKCCGNCCRNILLSDENGYLKNEEDFYKMKRKRGIFKYFEPNGHLTGEGEKAEGAILFKCKKLKNNKCSIYFIRPFFCRDYPAINPDFIQMGGVTLENCGFQFGVDKKFSDYL